MMEFADLIQFVKSRYQIDLLNYKESRILKRTRLFMARRDIADYGSLASYIAKRNNFDEFMQFHRIAVSYFLRDKTLFSSLISHIQKHGKTSEVLADAGMLSIGCSKGEELFSLVFMLRNKKMNIPGRIRGIDSEISLLDCARRGIWDKNSVREYDTFLRMYLDEHADGYRLKYKSGAGIEFMEFDIMKNSVDSLLPQYGLVMCRNFIIYLNEDYRDSFLAKISRLIKKEGLLFLGSSEYIHDPSCLGLEYIDHSIYRRVI